MKSLWQSYKIFLEFIGAKFYYLLGLMFAGALFEGLSVSVLMPILQHIGGEESQNVLARAMGWVLSHVGHRNSLGTMLAIMVVSYLLRSAFLMWETAYVGRIQADLLV